MVAPPTGTEGCMYCTYIQLLCPQVDPEQWDANVGEIFYLMLLLLVVDVIINHYYYCLLLLLSLRGDNGY